MSEISVPISAGELLDKITILRIKERRISDPAKLANVRKELRALERIWRAAVPQSMQDAEAQLAQVNETLWTIEDHIRDEERRKDFGARFIELARQVYLTNDRRAEIKRSINLRLGSVLIEEKSYQSYAADDISAPSAGRTRRHPRTAPSALSPSRRNP
jgi:hypothetical protein